MFNYGKGKKARKRYMHLVLLPRLFWMNKMVPSSKNKKEKKNPIFMRNVEAGKNVLRRQNELKNTRI